MTRRRPLAGVIIGLSFVSPLTAGPGTSGGLTLLEAPGARPAAMAEAAGALADDINIFPYNPSSLATLTRSHASFQYQKGIADDASGNFSIGGRRGEAGWGASFSYYDGGEIDLVDQAGARNVTAQQDMVLTAGYARPLGTLHWGAAVKFISTELIETDKATAFAFDIGGRAVLGSAFTFGLAAQNIGSKLEYAEGSDDLPRLLRASAAFSPRSSRVPYILSFDVPYSLQESEMEWATGAEVLFGPLALRAGYRGGRELEGISLGTGITMGSFRMDYAFGMVEDFDDRHRISVGLRFGTPAEAAQ